MIKPSPTNFAKIRETNPNNTMDSLELSRPHDQTDDLKITTTVITVDSNEKEIPKDDLTKVQQYTPNWTLGILTKSTGITVAIGNSIIIVYLFFDKYSSTITLAY